jgi:DNA-binding response OmpR family regulator
MAYVLFTGVDPALIATSKLLLQRAGHTVFTARDERQLTSACEHIRFDVAVIGHGMSPMAKEKTTSLLREKCPGIKILELFSSHQVRAIKNADSWLQVPSDLPDELSERVNELARRRVRKTG